MANQVKQVPDITANSTLYLTNNGMNLTGTTLVSHNVLPENAEIPVIFEVFGPFRGPSSESLPGSIPDEGKP